MRRWKAQQSVFMKATERFVDFEGAVRAGKTTPLVWKMINYAVQHPGIKMLLCRWTGDALEMQLKPKFYEECPRELLGPGPNAEAGTNENGWNSKQEYQSFTNGSIIYLRSLKSSDDGARFAKFTGLTLAVIGIDQPEELPEDIYVALKARLSQIGYPQQMLLTPNPPAPNHWLVNEFPIDNHLEQHLYINTTVYDAREFIGDDYIKDLEREYPPGHAMRRRFIDGQRGLSITGQPIYGKIFVRYLHVSEEAIWFPDFPLIESWDFGQKHPAVLWSQFTPWGWWNLLGEYLGERQFIDEVVPAVSALRQQLFPNLTDLQVCCDPAGADKQGHGIRMTAVDILNTHLRQIYGPQCGARFVTGSNRPEKREWAIQQISGYMTRLIQGRPALLAHPRCVVTIDGFEAGYVYDDRVYSMAALPNIRRPRKDGYYDHLQNTAEYTVLNYSSAQPLAANLASMSLRQRLQAMQTDSDDPFEWGPQHRPSRAGY